jgi:hypothetical protein
MTCNAKLQWLIVTRLRVKCKRLRKVPRAAPPDGDTFRGRMPVGGSAAGELAAVGDVRARHVDVRARVVQVGDVVALLVDDDERDHAGRVLLGPGVHAEGPEGLLGVDADRGVVRVAGGVDDRDVLLDRALGRVVAGREPPRGLGPRDGAGQCCRAGLLRDRLELGLGDAVALLACLAGVGVDFRAAGVDAGERLDDVRLAENLVDGRGLRRAVVVLGQHVGEREGCTEGDDEACDQQPDTVTTLLLHLSLS